MTKFEINQKLEVLGLTAKDEVAFNGEIVIVLALPGYNPKYPDSYGVLAKDGLCHPINPENVRAFPPSLPGGRKDLDVVSSWEAFNKATGLSSASFRKEDV